MILEAPPAAAMRYVNDWRGLVPSEYAGGGSVSSSLELRDDCSPAWPLVSCGRARLVSSRKWRTADALLDGSGATWSGGAYAGAAAETAATSSGPPGVALYGSHGSRWDSAASWSAVGKSDENEGGGRKAELPEASDAGYWGGGERWREGEPSSPSSSSSVGWRRIPASTSAVKHARPVSATVPASSAMPASSSTLRRLRERGPGEDKRLDALDSDNVVAEDGACAGQAAFLAELCSCGARRPRPRRWLSSLDVRGAGVSFWGAGGGGGGRLVCLGAGWRRTRRLRPGHSAHGATKGIRMPGNPSGTPVRGVCVQCGASNGEAGKSNKEEARNRDSGGKGP